MSTWNLQTLQDLITHNVEENLNLDYKAADSLQSMDRKRKEITKDVSAMANSAGGTIVYGMAEHSDPSQAHLPEKIDPVVRTEFSKETLEHIIGTIQPRIKDVIIYSVPVPPNPDHVVYVVEIPQSSTAHQARDKKYYKRFNFESVPMEDYEVRDVMFRQSHPAIRLDFALRLITKWSGPPIPMPGAQATMSGVAQLVVTATDAGGVYAQYVNAIITLPTPLLLGKWGDESKGPDSCAGSTQSVTLQNTLRDVVGYEMYTPKYGPSRFDPILPGMSRVLDEIELVGEPDKVVGADATVTWSVFADNAPRVQGRFLMADLEVIDERDAED